MELINEVFPLAVTILVVVLGFLAGDALTKLSKWLKSKESKDQLGVVDAVTDLVVNFVEKEFTGKAGQIKLSKAMEKSRDILAEKGIVISEEELRIAVENGVDKVKERQLSTGMLEGISLTPPQISHGTEPFEIHTTVDPSQSNSRL